MATSEDNVLTHGFSGKIGDLLVFKRVKGKTVVSKTPSKFNRQVSEKQKEQQEHFQEAVIYGKTVMVTPELKAIYEPVVPPGKSVYQVALADFLNAPQIKSVDVGEYTGETGSSIRIRVTDNFMVKDVKVSIYNSEGVVIEHGEAIRQVNGVDWLYTATSGNANIQGNKIVIRASDIPGNITDSNVNI